MRSTGPVVAVVVTHRRRAMLAVCLAAVAENRPDRVVVVDNGSGDGTAEWVAQHHPEVDLVVLAANTGGAGGFAAGLARALGGHDARAVWLLDDDTVPGAGALAALVQVLDGPVAPVLVASRVLWTDGRPHPLNTPRPVPWLRRDPRLTDGCRRVRSASFVSVLVSAAAVRAAGPPVADYFLWNDDFEFTTRLTRHGRGVLCPASVVEHRTAQPAGSDADPGDRFYLEVRNKLWMFGRSASLTRPEKVLYGAATARRWFRTVRHGTDRSRLGRLAVRGTVDAVRRGPRSNADALRDPRPLQVTR